MRFSPEAQAGTRATARRGRGGAWLWAIVLVGALLRFFPIWFGLPYTHARPDEETALGRTLAILGGDLNPHFFHWPSLTFYLFAAVFRAASWIRGAASLDPELTVAGYTLLGRGFVALAGTATIVIVFQIGRRIVDTTTGLCAALFLAVAILHVRESHFAMTDVLMTLFATGSMALLLRAVDGYRAAASAKELRWFAAAGLAGGFAASTKYSGGAVIVAMAVAQLSLLKRPLTLSVWAPSVGYGLACGAGFLIGTPYAILDFDAFKSGLTFTVTHLSAGHGVDVGRGWSYHLTRSLPYGVGLPTFVVAVAGVVPFVRHYQRQAAIVGAFTLALYASLATGYTVFFRYILPLVPFVCLSGAIGVRRLGQWMAPRVRLQERVATGLLAGLVAAPSLVNSAWFDLLLARTDTRVLAARWLEQRLTPDASLHDAGGLYMKLDLRHLRFHEWDLDPSTKTFGHPEGKLADWLVLYESPLLNWARSSPELRHLALQRYALEQSFIGARRRTAAVYDQQDAFFLPLSGFGTVERPGPTILIYRQKAQLGSQDRPSEGRYD